MEDGCELTRPAGAFGSEGWRLIRVTALVAATVILAHGTGGFHEPRATGSEMTAETLAIDISVLLDVSEGPVVMHLFLPGEEEETKALLDRGGGHWGTQLELLRANWRVVFEDLNTGAVSEEFSLTDLGVDRTLFGHASGEESEPLAVRLVLPALLLAAAAVIATGAVVWATDRKTLAKE